MKIILATDSSEQSKAAVEEVASRPFPPNTEVRIVSAYATLILNLEPMGVSPEYYAQANHHALKAAEDATENAAKILRQKNTALAVRHNSYEHQPVRR